MSSTVAFFGATGGVTNAILIHTLLAGHKATALVRTPQKLRDQLTSQGLSSDNIKNLTIIEGNALDLPAVKRTLTASGPGTLPSVIVNGLGGTPSMTFKLSRPFQIFTLDNPHICETAATTLTNALKEIYTNQPALKSQRAAKPLLAFISTTGITRGPEDVPFAIRFLYHQMLTIPHADKKKTENIFRADAENTNEEGKVFRGFVGVRPTLLTPFDNSPSNYKDVVGLAKVRAGTEMKPAIGYSIKRGDVGLWVWENVVREAVGGGKGKWEGEMVSLTS